MQLSYKLEIHKRKGKKLEYLIKMHNKVKKGNNVEWVQLYTTCCEDMGKALSNGFISIETDQRNFINVRYDDKYIKLKEPIVCLSTMSEDGGFSGECEHDQMVVQINNCPFCQAEITYECVEKKRLVHECIKKKVSYEECEDKVTEEIL